MCIENTQDFILYVAMVVSEYFTEAAREQLNNLP